MGKPKALYLGKRKAPAGSGVDTEDDSGILEQCRNDMIRECNVEREAEFLYRETKARCALRKVRILRKIASLTPIPSEQIDKELAAP